VQETEQFAPVRGARIVLADSDGVRANLTASWLRQMNHEVYVVDGLRADDFNLTGAWRPSCRRIRTPYRGGRRRDLVAGCGKRRSTPRCWISPVRRQLREAAYSRRLVRASLGIAGGFIAGLQHGLQPNAQRLVLTCGSSLLARYVAADLRSITDLPVLVLSGGTSAWKDAGLPLASGAERLASQLTDRYRRPYEGTDNRTEAMQAYLDWEFGLVAQLGRDGTHGFQVL
jgi:rhodanese-related sulfurtransferase